MVRSTGMVTRVDGFSLMRIASQKDEIGELARFDGTFQIFLVRSVGSVDSADANRFFHGNFLLGSPNVSFGVRGGHFGLQRHLPETARVFRKAIRETARSRVLSSRSSCTPDAKDPPPNRKHSQLAAARKFCTSKVTR